MSVVASQRNSLVDRAFQRVVNPQPSGGEWFASARLGLFVHWGLYSIWGRGEWVLFNEDLPREHYNKLADEFTGREFDATELARLARDSGAKYVVLTTRHHDGYCLWNTKTTPFNSVRTAAGRDFVAEFADACRAAGLRVGLYYSLMSWQHPASHDGPHKNPLGWAAMIDEAHAQLRELMSHYGTIDLLWYDGAFVPGIGDRATIARHYRSRDLNAMIRQLQPGILINDRSGLAEDFETPEQHITPATPGRKWEACITINDHWGYYAGDRNYKSIDQILKCLGTCARFGGNLLLNVGPRADGAVEPEARDRLHRLGEWLRTNGDAIYGSERSTYSAADHVAGMATVRGRRAYFQLPSDIGPSVRLALRGERVTSARILGSDRPLVVDPPQHGTLTVQGLPQSKAADGLLVLEVEVAAKEAFSRPASLIGQIDEQVDPESGGLVFGVGRHQPEEAPFLEADQFAQSEDENSAALTDSEQWCPGWRGREVLTSASGTIAIELNVPHSGLFTIQLGVIAEKPGLLKIGTANQPVVTRRMPFGGYPDSIRLENVRLEKGRLPLRLSSAGRCGLYGIRLQPQWRAISSEKWQTIGPFPTEFGFHQPPSKVRDAMERAYSPEREDDEATLHQGAGNRPLRWKRSRRRSGQFSNLGVNFPSRVGSRHTGVCYARCTIVSPEAREVQLLLGCDWWANASLNGMQLTSDRPAAEIVADGARFCGWKPRPAALSLRKGENTLLVKCHPGTAACWFTCWISDPGDLHICAGE